MNTTYSPPPPRRWRCSFCKRDKVIAATADKATVQRCPDCHNMSCVWLEFTPRPRRVAINQDVEHSPFLKRQPQPMEVQL